METPTKQDESNTKRAYCGSDRSAGQSGNPSRLDLDIRHIGLEDREMRMLRKNFDVRER
jgi:hypothetical protein